MNLKKILGTVTAAIALTSAAVLYTSHAVKSSDHQDTYNLANKVGHNTSADITDVFVFPATDPNNVVFAMDVSPLTAAGMGTSTFFDPTLMWQFKISHQDSGIEDQVIQFGVTGTDANQTVTMYGPTAPNEVGTTNTFVSLKQGSFGFNNTAATLANGTIKVFAGPRADPFAFDLFQFFKILPDRAYNSHTSQTDPGQGNTLGTATPTFNGFKAGDTNKGNQTPGDYACSTAAPQNALTEINGGFNVLSFVVELPKSLITTGFSNSKIHVWATTSSSTTNS